MNLLNIEENYKNQIEAIWNDKKYQSVPYIDRGYVVQRDIPFDSILFIGINPSYNEKNPDQQNSFFYSTHQQEKVHPYFKKFKEIAEEIKIKWSHLDLLYIRQTNQNEIKTIFNSPIGNDFFHNQLAISKSIIEKSKPKVIVVSNAYARDLFKLHCKIETIFDEKLGTHIIINNNDLEGIPVFYTSMLTGQRALDIGSYDRLVWHIKYAINSIEKKQ